MNRKDLFDVVKSAIASSAIDDVGLLAAGLTYYVFLSLFPLLLLGLTLATFFVDEQTARDFIFTEVEKFIPGASQFLEDIVTDAFQNRGGVLIIGLLVLAYSASNAFGTLDKSINRAWGTEKMPNMIIAKLFSFLMMAILGVLLILSLLANAALTFVQDFVVSLDTAITNLILVLLLILANLVASVGFVFIGFLLMYRFLPKAKVRFNDVWLAALIAALSWAVVKVGFTIYLGTAFANFNAVYGTLGAVVALLFWLYISSMIILYGAEFAAEVYRLRVTRESVEDSSGASGALSASAGPNTRESPWFKKVPNNTQKSPN